MIRQLPWLVLVIACPHAWSAALGQEPAGRPGAEPVYAVAFSPDCQTLATGCHDGKVRLRDPASGKIRDSWDAWASRRGPIGAVVFGAGGRLLATTCPAESSVRIWDAASGAELVRCTHYGVSAIAFAPDGATLASVGVDQALRLWEVSTGRLRQTLTGHKGAVVAVAYSPDGKTLATGGQDGAIRLWDADPPRARATLQDNGRAVYTIAFTADGGLAAARQDGTVRVWDVATGRERTTLKTGNAVVTAMAVSPDARTVAAGGADGQVRLWDLETERERATLGGYPKAVSGVAFSPNGRALAVAVLDGTVKVWDVGWLVNGAGGR